MSIRSSLPALAVGACLALPASAMAQVQFAKECALKEIPAITLIEQHGEAGVVSADRLVTAQLTMMAARAICSTGRVGDALELYQRVFDLGPVATKAAAATSK